MTKNNDYVRDEEFASVELQLKNMLNEARTQFLAGSAGEVYSVGGREIVQTALKKMVDVALDAQREFAVAKALRETDHKNDEFKIAWNFIMSDVIGVGNQMLTIDPDDVETIDFSLPVPTEVDEKGNRKRTGPPEFNLHMTFKEKGPRWEENKPATPAETTRQLVMELCKVNGVNPSDISSISYSDVDGFKYEGTKH